MIYKENYKTTTVVMCHDGFFKKIHALVNSLHILENCEAENESCDELRWSIKPAISLIRQEIWRLFKEIESQRAVYSHEEWHEMYDLHKKRRIEVAIDKRPEDIDVD